METAVSLLHFVSQYSVPHTLYNSLPSKLSVLLTLSYKRTLLLALHDLNTITAERQLTTHRAKAQWFLGEVGAKANLVVRELRELVGILTPNESIKEAYYENRY